MSLNRTLERLFRAIRCEVARNPAFAGELEAALREYRPRRGPPRPMASPPKPIATLPMPVAAPSQAGTKPPALRPPKPSLNPIAFARREGVDGLRGELLGGAYDEAALRLLLEEHNLDPAGAAREEGFAELVERLTDQAQRRLERDQKLFAY